MASACLSRGNVHRTRKGFARREQPRACAMLSGSGAMERIGHVRDRFDGHELLTLRHINDEMPTGFVGGDLGAQAAIGPAYRGRRLPARETVIEHRASDGARRVEVEWRWNRIEPCGHRGGVGLPNAARAKLELGGTIAWKEWVPAEAKGKRRIARVDDLQRRRQLLGRKLHRLPCTIGKGPLARALAQSVMSELEQRALRRRSDDAPGALPAVAMNRMRLIRHVARQGIR